MSWLVWSLFIATLLGATLVGVAMLQKPILARMAARNAGRRPRQTATVIAGLMVGTAIIAASLVAGGSAAFAIKGYVYQSLGDIDESVSIDGYPYFPQSVYDAMKDDARLRGRFDAVSANAIWGGSVEAPTGLFEPSAAFVGFEPESDAAFGPFELVGGKKTDGRDIGHGEAIITERLADEIDAKPGDRITVRFSPPVDPFVPHVELLNGTAGPSTPIPTIPGLPGGVQSPVHIVNVPVSATRITIVAAWDPSNTIPPTAAPAVTLTDPEGHVYLGEGGSTAFSIVWVNVTAEPDSVLLPGHWSVKVNAPLVPLVYRAAAIVIVPVYDLQKLEERVGGFSQDRSAPQLPPGADELLKEFSKQQTATLTVKAITDGGRGDLFDFRKAVFLRMDDLQAMLGRPGQINLIKFSNPGDAEDGVKGTAGAMPLLNATLSDIQQGKPLVASIQALESRALKKEFLDVADEAGQTLTGLLVFAGSLSVITGLFLIVNIFTMLAEERRSELGMARAVGLGRRDLVRLFGFEGSLYAVVAAAAGAVLGLGLAKLLIVVLNGLIQRLAGDDFSFPPIPFRPSLDSVMLAFCVGVLLTFLTILGASIRQSRLNVVRAIRRIEEPLQRNVKLSMLLTGLVVAVLGIAATIMGYVSALRPGGLEDNSLSFKVFGPVLLVAGTGLALKGAIATRRLYPVLAGLLGAYYTVQYFTLHRYDNVDEANIVGPIRGVLLTLCVVVLAVHFEAGTRLAGRLLAIPKRLRAIAIPAVSYPLHRKFRTGMTLAMFSVVILSIGFFSIFGALFQTDPSRQTGGFDIEGYTSVDVEDIAAYDAGLIPAGTIASMHRLEDYATEDPHFITVEGGETGKVRDFYHHVIGYNEAFAKAQGYTLLFRSDEYRSDVEAYEAVLHSDDKIIVSYQYSTNSRNQGFAYDVGDTLEMHLGNETLAFTVVGIQEQYTRSGVWLPIERVRGLFPNTEPSFLWKLPGDPTVEHAKDIAKLLEKNYKEVGLHAESSVAKVLDQQKSFRQILGAMKLFLALGLIVGVLSLGIVTSRSVLERRQEIGMLRALGYTGRMIRSIFFIEVTATILIAALVGLACAVLVTFGLWYSIIRELNYPYVIPWGEIGLLMLVSYVVALAATWAPIGRSAKVPPAEALRYIE